MVDRLLMFVIALFNILVIESQETQNIADHCDLGDTALRLLIFQQQSWIEKLERDLTAVKEKLDVQNQKIELLESKGNFNHSYTCN